MKSAGKARNNGLYRHIRTSKEIIRNLLNDYHKNHGFASYSDELRFWLRQQASPPRPVKKSGYILYMVYPHPVAGCRMAHPLYFSSTHRRTCSTKR